MHLMIREPAVCWIYLLITLSYLQQNNLIEFLLHRVELELTLKKLIPAAIRSATTPGCSRVIPSLLSFILSQGIIVFKLVTFIWFNRSEWRTWKKLKLLISARRIPFFIFLTKGQKLSRTNRVSPKSVMLSKKNRAKGFQATNPNYICSLFPKASLGVHTFTWKWDFLFTCKLNSFSYQWLCTRPRCDREAQSNSEMAYFPTLENLNSSYAPYLTWIRFFGRIQCEATRVLLQILVQKTNDHL